LTWSAANQILIQSSWKVIVNTCCKDAQYCRQPIFRQLDTQYLLRGKSLVWMRYHFHPASLIPSLCLDTRVRLGCAWSFAPVS
jgi:hypothetical protein